MDGYIVSLDGSSAPASREAVEAALGSGKLLWLDLRDLYDHVIRIGRPDRQLPRFLLGIGTEVLAVVSLFWLFRKRGWL